MDLGIAGQGVFPDRNIPASSFFPKKPIVNVVGGTLRIDKDALAARSLSAPSVTGNDDGLFLRLIAAIRAFLGRICRALLPAKFFSATTPTGSASAPMASMASSQDGQRPVLSETDREIVLDGVPEATLERVRQTIDELIHFSVGDGLPSSLKAALAMPELGRRQAFRVLLQQNLGDTKQMRDVREDLHGSVARMIAPFAETHGMDEESALALFRADLEQGGGAIANRVDPNSEIRSHVFELKRLDSALAALAKARGIICTRALEGESHTREELATVIAEHGLDTDFLFKAETSAATTPETQPSENYLRGGNVISMSSFRRTGAAVEGAVPDDYAVDAEATTTNHVREAIAVLVEQGVLESSSADALAQATVVDTSLSDEGEFDSDFETEIHGDDLSSFGKKDKAAIATPKL